MTKIFDKNGQVDAADKTDALAQLVRLANIISGPSNSEQYSTSSYSDEQTDYLLKNALETPDGKLALGQSMANPIRRNLDYMGVGRKALVVDPLPQGVLPRYEKDIDVSAIVLSSNGSVPESMVRGDSILVPEFDIVANPTVKIAEVRRRRFNIIERAQQKARQEIQAQEDKNIFAALDAASDFTSGMGENTRQAFNNGVGGTMEMPDLLAMSKQVDRWDLVTAKYFMHISQFNDIRGWSWRAGGGNNQYGGFDPVTSREVLQTGLFGSIWGSDIIVTKLCPDGVMYACAEPEFVGVFPVRQDIEVLPADEPKQLKLGWVISETVGVTVVNPRGVSSASNKI